MIGRILVCVFIMILTSVSYGEADIKLLRGQTLYVSDYSHVFSGDRGMPFNLSVTLIIRNTDTKNGIGITSVGYYDDNGKLIRRFISDPVRLGALASVSFFIKESDVSGGIGSKFIVRWRAEKKVNAPIIESVMIGARGGQGISFIGSSQEISE